MRSLTDALDGPKALDLGPNDKRVVGMAKPPTIADHVARAIYLHKLVDFNLDPTGLAANMISQMTQGREEQFHDMNAPLYNPKRHASDQDLMVRMSCLPWDENECITINTFRSAVSLISLAMVRPLCLLQTNKLAFKTSRDLSFSHVKWFQITNHKEIKTTEASIRKLLRENNALVVIKRPLDKNTRHVKDVSLIVARIEEASAQWTPVRNIAVSVLETIVTKEPIESLSYSRISVAKIHEARKQITNSNVRFLKTTW